MTELTNLRILQLAKAGALEKWSREQERLERNPDNDITKFKEQRAWAELREIEEMLKKAETKETLPKIEKTQKI